MYMYMYMYLSITLYADSEPSEQSASIAAYVGAK